MLVAPAQRQPRVDLSCVDMVYSACVVNQTLKTSQFDDKPLLERKGPRVGVGGDVQGQMGCSCAKVSYERRSS